MKASIQWTLGLLVLLSTAGPAFAGSSDAAGCKDHPLFNRVPDFYISQCDTSDFDLVRFPVGPLLDKRSATGVNTNVADVEGRYTVLRYNLNDGSKAKPSPLQIRRNFENAVKKAGGSVEGDYVGDSGLSFDESVKAKSGRCGIYPQNAMTFKLQKGGTEVWTLLCPVDRDGREYIVLIGERAAMEQAIVAQDLLGSLNKVGFVAIYLNFDTGKAVLKPDAAPQLDQMAQLLKGNAGLNVEVGGHTDNVGDASANQKLSDARAQTVMQELVKRGIAANRLAARGYGHTVPIADNRLEDGRAKNRRVELVRK